MGSEKYPDQAEYSKFIGENGGYSNAYTSLTETNYHFECSKEAFYEALDIFAQFYISPLFKDDCVGKEKNAVNSEAEMNLNNDSWKKFQLRKSLSKKGSIYQQFSIGNLETLDKEGIVEALKQFHKDFYSANQMGLVICTPDSLDKMQEETEKIFSLVVDKNLEYSGFAGEEYPFPEEYNGKVIKMVPVKELDQISIKFALPSFYQHSKNKVLNYFSHLYGHESEGSILNYLIEEGLATELYSSGDDTEDYFSEITIVISLTKKGLKEWEKVVSVVGAYTKMLVAEGAQEWVYQECKDVAEFGFQ
jgi:insulysin